MKIKEKIKSMLCDNQNIYTFAVLNYYLDRLSVEGFFYACYFIKTIW